MVPTRTDWVREHCQLLRAISAEFGRTRPFDGLTIGTGIHLEAKTAALLLRSYQTLREWAQWALDNMGATDAGTAQEPPAGQ